MAVSHTTLCVYMCLCVCLLDIVCVSVCARAFSRSVGLLCQVRTISSSVFSLVLKFSVPCTLTGKTQKHYGSVYIKFTMMLSLTLSYFSDIGEVLGCKNTQTCRSLRPTCLHSEWVHHLLTCLDRKTEFCFFPYVQKSLLFPSVCPRTIRVQSCTLPFRYQTSLETCAG